MYVIFILNSFINSHSSLNCFYYLRVPRQHGAASRKSFDIILFIVTSCGIASVLDGRDHEPSDGLGQVVRFVSSCHQVAMMAKNKISISDLTRETTHQTHRVRPLLGDLDEDPANKKVIKTLYLSLGGGARKQFMDKYPHKALWNLKALQLINLCVECFRKKRNRTLDRH